MSILDKVKNHISDNRGKYGMATGAGAAYGISQLPDAPVLVNKVGMNILAHGQNLALDTADKIGYGREQLQNLGLENKIRPEDIQASNEFYDSKLGQAINPGASNMVNAMEQSSKLYNKVQEAKAQAQDVVQQTQDQGNDYLAQGVNYVKSLNPFQENTIILPIKQAIVEGYLPETLLEVKDWTDAQRNTFLRRGIQATNKTTPTKLMANALPLAGMIVGGAVGNNIHGDDGSIDGIVYDDQANNDDEYDMTGALIGAGAGIGAYKAINGPVSKSITNRLGTITGIEPSQATVNNVSRISKVAKNINDLSTLIKVKRRG